jgi:hypothetical protein
MAGYERDPSLPDVEVPWSDIPTSDTVDEGRYVIRVSYFQEKKSQEGKRMAVLFSTIAEGPLTDVPFPIQNYVLGTEDDPLCTKDPNTWRKSYGGRQLNQLLEACGTVKNEKSLSESLRRAEQARFQAYVTKSIQKEGQYAGSEQNRVTKYAACGQEMAIPGQRTNIANNGTSAQPRNRMRPTFDTSAEDETVPGLND